ncbi:MAG: DUF5615 family PIN-like protein [Meiothermus sp.]|nr:DUF5615 family PIN-like protein [Meiothermus sp.]
MRRRPWARRLFTPTLSGPREGAGRRGGGRSHRGPVPSLKDPQVLVMAGEKGALLLTADKDFGELVFRQNLVPGEVLPLRLEGLSPGEKAEQVAWALRSHGEALLRAFSVLDPRRLRVRKLPG